MSTDRDNLAPDEGSPEPLDDDYSLPLADDAPAREDSWRLESRRRRQLRFRLPRSQRKCLAAGICLGVTGLAILWGFVSLFTGGDRQQAQAPKQPAAEVPDEQTAPRQRYEDEGTLVATRIVRPAEPAPAESAPASVRTEPEPPKAEPTLFTADLKVELSGVVSYQTGGEKAGEKAEPAFDLVVGCFGGSYDHRSGTTGELVYSRNSVPAVQLQRLTVTPTKVNVVLKGTATANDWAAVEMNLKPMLKVLGLSEDGWVRKGPVGQFVLNPAAFEPGVTK